MRKYCADKMRSLLSAKKINISGVAQDAGIPSATVHNLKEGAVPLASTLVAVADVLEKDLDYFFEEDLTHRLNRDEGEDNGETATDKEQ